METVQNRFYITCQTIIRVRDNVLEGCELSGQCNLLKDKGKVYGTGNATGI